MNGLPHRKESYGRHHVSMDARAFDSAKIIQAAGDQFIYEEPPPYRLNAFSMAPDNLPNERLAAQPSRLLRVNHEIVPFTGRDTEIRELIKWRDASNIKTGVLLVHGAGGQGKTRFVTHIARSWENDGWNAYRAVARDDTSGPHAGEMLQADADGVLIVADYADRWCMTDLLSLLRDAAGCVGKVRVLLLARSAETWWDTLAYHLDRDLDIDSEKMLLAPLGENPDDRPSLFEDARGEFARYLRVANSEYIEPPTRLESDNQYGLILTIHMAALAKVLAHSNREVAPQDSAELSAFLLARERAHWRTLHNRREEPINTAPDIMAQIVYTATVTGPLAHRHGLEALRCAEVQSLHHPGQLLRDHARCYPSGEPGVVLEPLYPDRLGEDFVALTTPGHRSQQYRPDPWASDALQRLLSPAGESDQGSPWTSAAMNLVTEIAARWPHMASMTRAGTITSGRHHRRL